MTNTIYEFFYTVYKITNLVNNKIYIGVHKTTNPYDNYLVSNSIIKRAIKKYGKDSFKKEILFYCDDEITMYLKEADIVNTIFVNRKDTYNIVIGGKGNSKLDSYVVDNKIGIHALTFEERSKISKVNQSNRGVEERKEMCSKGGKFGGVKNRDSKLGIFGLSQKDKRNNAIKGGKSGVFSKSYYEKNNLPDSDRIKEQSNRGKIGGVKNKGFRWYNDGNYEYKYTIRDQDIIPFDIFLSDNNIYQTGRIINKQKLK